MMILALSAFLGLALFAQMTSIGLVLARRRRPGPVPLPGDGEGTTILRPCCGIENHLDATVRSVLMLDHPRYEVLFCVARADDPVIPFLRGILADYPDRDARILVGDERISTNPKLNNVVKGWNAARYDRIVMSDSNLLVPPSYLDEIEHVRDARTAFVCSPPVGTHVEGFSAELEAAFLNTYQARWQLLADELGIAFAQGKTIAMRRSDMEDMGGLAALAAEAAEDAAATKAAHRFGRRVRLVRRPFAQPLGYRRFADVWRRQVRWARLRRSSFPLAFFAEIFTGFVPAAAAAIALVAMGELDFWTLPLLAFVWYAAEYLLARAYRWPAGPSMLLAAVVRDLLLPCVWVEGWVGYTFEWRGNAMSTNDDKELLPKTTTL
ncbi:glycosyltransferase [Rhizobiaceae bacterium BDR2-2]|uniref:Glycosyltransferase n=1 Tax=Ectorhizobium quercum TaxID=2965071 RepID=A0AAE3N3I5_9HYPH|nr:glycosyltransferase [Ectorhizobium quercum]MCX8999014.1 glycosyltransferase [Ectorhizobium quercum]